MNKVFISLLAGITVGILIAPARGSETRRRLANRFNDLTEDISDEADDICNSGKKLMQEVRTDARDLANSFKNVTEPNNA